MLELRSPSTGISEKRERMIVLRSIFTGTIWRMERINHSYKFIQKRVSLVSLLHFKYLDPDHIPGPIPYGPTGYGPQLIFVWFTVFATEVECGKKCLFLIK